MCKISEVKTQFESLRQQSYFTCTSIYFVALFTKILLLSTYIVALVSKNWAPVALLVVLLQIKLQAFRARSNNFNRQYCFIESYGYHVLSR